MAQVYSNALARGNKPLQAVKSVFQTSTGTASRWVATARERDYLPKTERGKAQGNRHLVKEAGS